MAGIFDGLDQERLEDLGGRFLAAILAVVEFGRPIDDDPADHAMYDAALAKALIETQAAIVADPHCDEEQQDALVAGITNELRRAVADRRAAS